ncbi:MAG: hypothetical protein JO082_07315 [Mycobacterium sp.]|nr:hypothetical protein [Mycobacterium sp.]MBV9721712.1 hypothetical protein [Mycobacterium sp.]
MTLPWHGRTVSWPDDVILTLALWIVLVLAAAVVGLIFTLSNQEESEHLVGPLMYVGMGIAFLGATVGPVVSLIVSIWRRWYLFIWPAGAIGVIIVVFVVGCVIKLVDEIRP